MSDRLSSILLPHVIVFSRTMTGVIAFFSMLVLVMGVATAQAIGEPNRPGGPNPAEAGKTPGAKETEEGDTEKFPTPQNVELQTRDGLQMEATFYAGTMGKNSVAVIMLHDWQRSRKDFEELALQLQSKGHAVIAPDLRGHGGSKNIVQRGTKRVRVINSKIFRKADVGNIIRQDMEEVKRFLMRKNNAGELNIEKLCVVGVGTGAVVALNWAATDWSWPELPNRKQGRDVKSLVLISPESVFKGITVREAQKYWAIREKMSLLVIVGKKPEEGKRTNKFLKNAEMLYKTITRGQTAGKKENKEEKAKNKRHFFVATPTSLQGANLLSAPEFNVIQQIAKFIDLRLTEKDFEWTNRSGKFD